MTYLTLMRGLTPEAYITLAPFKRKSTEVV
jgi:hypothetical protein